ncbi:MULTISPECIES: LysR family transcriptional regulator [Mesobacillus]|uniref:HTH lysR-type domain-containing protein n=2 Tax=Mesobacillus TaxID=2675231 RepID=A0A0D6Z8T9_9BACI|nr:MULTISPECIES: LysR family transcriptional regulator [Mesobacillus]KIY21745.1 hypothetical protein UB32_12275 [Mesobacillus subterraneus]MDQ0415531.1 DNA-binding transcriptional LysR family regulator [Mesobacillus stamsii]
MEIRYLQTFKAIVDLGSFTKAAEFLGYAQSTITFHIKSIEDELGRPVFDRIGKKVFLTETGHLLMPHVIKMLCIYKDLKDVTMTCEDMKGELVISAPEALLIYRLPAVIKEFKETYPNIDLKLKHLDPSRLKMDLSQGDVDLAFIVDEERKEEGIYFEKLVKEPMMFISHDYIPLYEKGSLKDKVPLFTEKGCGYRTLFEKLIEQNISHKDSVVNKGMEFWSIEALKECVVCGLGIGVLPYIVVKREMNQSNLFAQEIKESTLSTYLAYHNEKWVSPSLNAFLNTIRKYAGEWEKETFNISKVIS